jgi:hypothetical protein
MPCKFREGGINEVIGTILMVVLIIALAVIIGGIVMGYIVIQPKSAYIPPRIEVVDYAGSKAISLYSRGGDPAALDPAEDSRYVLEIFLDTDRGTFKVIPDADARTWNPGQTLYLYYNGSRAEYRAGREIPEFQPDQIPDASILLRVVDKRAQLLVLKEGVAVGGGGTATLTPTTTSTTTPTATTTATPTCTLGTGWRIWNRDTVSHNYILKVNPSGPVIETGSIPAKTQRFVWYSLTSPYQGNLTTLENGESEVRGSGALICQFVPYTQSGPSAASQTTLQLNPM